MSRLTSVVLPAPFGPTTATSSPWCTAMLTLVERAEGTVGFADIARFEQQGHAVLHPILRPQVGGQSGNALRKSDDDQRQNGAEHEPPVFGQRLQLVLQQA